MSNLRQPTLYSILDSKVCFNRELPSIEYPILSLVGVKREVAKAFSKALLAIEHHVCANF